MDAQDKFHRLLVFQKIRFHGNFCSCLPFHYIREDLNRLIMRFSLRFLLCTIFCVCSLFSFASPGNMQGVMDTCVKDPNCSFNYDFEEHEVSNVPGLKSYVFRCFPLYAEGILTMNNGDSIYVSQGACEHFYWEASLYTKRGVSN